MFLGGALALGACGGADRVEPHHAADVVARSGERPLAGVDGSFWEPVTSGDDGAALDGALTPEEAAARCQRTEAFGRSVAALAPAARARLEQAGLVVVPAPGAGASVAALYTHLLDADVPVLLGPEALFEVVRLALDRALAETETLVLVPALTELGARLEDHLAAEARAAPSDLVVPYRLARGVVAVARSLADPTYRPPLDLALAVATEVELVQRHAGVARSALLGVPLDYASMAPDGDAPAFRALAWLAGAPLVLLARGEADGATADVQTARAHARAALLLARLLDPTVDAALAEGLRRVGRAFAFVYGAPDELPLSELGAVAARLGVDVRDARTLVDVTAVDRVRRAVAAARPPALERPGAASVRVLGASAPADARALLAAAVASVAAQGSSDAARAAGASPRGLPSTLAVAAWLGSAEAAAELGPRGEGGEAAPGAPAPAAPKAPPAEHASLWASELAALATTTGAPDRPLALAPGQAAQRQRLESTLAAWTLARRTFRPLVRAPFVAPARSPSPAARTSRAPVAVQASARTVAALEGLVRQARRGLVAVAGLAPGGQGAALLDAAEGILRDALVVLGSDPRAESLAAALPGRVVALSQQAGLDVASTVRAVDVHVDRARGLVLQAATGAPEVLYTCAFVRGARVMVAGPHVPHYELVAPESSAGDDRALAARLGGGSPPKRPAFVASFHVER